MNGYRKRSVSSSSDEDLQSMLDNKKGKNDLFSTQVLACEFCDEVFLNRYNHLVHNANHIIIPLLRQTYFRCQECQQQCRTDRKLRKHIKKKHPHCRSHRKKKHSTDHDTEASQINNNNDETDKYRITDLACDVNEKEKETESTKTNNVIEPVLTNGNSIKVEVIEIESDDDDDIIDIKDINSHDIEREKIRNRLIFEDDEEDIIKPNGLISDLVSDIKVSVDLEPWMSCITGDGEAETEESKEEWRSKTVSYQELIDMQDVGCKYCNKTFPNRLSLLKHEPTHMSNKKLLRRPFLCQFCDWYVSSDPQGLIKHYKHTHPGKELRPVQSIHRGTCEHCNLKYISLKKHMKNYHHIDDTEEKRQEEEDGVNKDSDKRQEEESDKNNSDIIKEDIFLIINKKNKPPHFQKKVINVCDLCCSFLKNVTNMLYYRSVGEKSVYGERQTCDRCLKQFFSVNLVEMSSRAHSHITERKKEKPLSNRDRLKNIQNRLKLINKIRKYFCVFYSFVETIYCGLFLQ